MSSFLRLSLLAMCVAIGVTLAVCLAINAPPPSNAADVAVTPAIGASTSSKHPLTTAYPAFAEPHRSAVARESSEKTTSPAPLAFVMNAAEDDLAGRRLSHVLIDDRLMIPSVLSRVAPAVTQQVLPKLPPVPKANDVSPAVGPDLSKFTSPEGREQLRQLLQAKSKELEGSNPFEDDPAAKASAGAKQAEVLPAPAEKSASEKPAKRPTITRSTKPRALRGPGEGDERLSINIQDNDIRDVLEMLAEQGGLSILPAGTVRGKVSATLTDVNVETALDVILRTTGFTSRRDGKFIYVGTPVDFQNMERALDRVGTRVYRPNYVKASELQAIVTPLLTQGIGAISINTPSEVGIGADGSKTGGDGFAGNEALLVKDYEAVLVQVDQVVAELDKRPMQVAIEAMVLSVSLSDENAFGVDFQFLRNNKHIKLATGSPAANLAQVDFNEGGLKFGFLDSSLGAFLDALETIGKTDVIATPRLMCVNKHRAEILIGSQLGYISSTVTETSTAQSVQFLEVGTQLRLRPFISSDGTIRLEVHPELSTGSVEVKNNFTLPQKEVTQVTTNVMTRDGCTVIIGGLMREDLDTSTSQVPLLGSLPGVGFLFRHKKDTQVKREVLVLITPHIVYEPDSAIEGHKAAAGFHDRHANYADHMSPIGYEYLSRKYRRLAADAYAAGDTAVATRCIDLSIHFNPQSRASLELREQIQAGPRPVAPSEPRLGESPLDGQQIPAWLMNDLEAAPPAEHPYDSGRPGHKIDIQRPARLQ